MQNKQLIFFTENCKLTLFNCTHLRQLKLGSNLFLPVHFSYTVTDKIKCTIKLSAISNLKCTFQKICFIIYDIDLMWC